MTATADIKKLRKGLTKFLRPICDDGSWKETSAKHINISCKYQGCSLKFTFSLSQKSSTISAVYRTVKKTLANCGVRPPSNLKLKMVLPGDVDYYLEQLFDFLDTQEKLFTGSNTGITDSYSYLKEAKHTQRERVKSLKGKKPYKKRISYEKLGGLVVYERYYIWQRRKFRDGKYRKGYLQESKGTYLEALAMWKQKRK